MIKTTTMLKDELAEYANPLGKIGRMVESGELVPLVRGLYTNNPLEPGAHVAGSIYGPSYLSFEYALAYHGFIPERVQAYTSATCGKHKTKSHTNALGRFEYRDVPAAVFAQGVHLCEQGESTYWLASPEKALCDQLYKMPPAANQKELASLLFEFLRIDPAAFNELSTTEIANLAEKYRCSNVALLAKYMERTAK